MLTFFWSQDKYLVLCKGCIGMRFLLEFKLARGTPAGLSAGIGSRTEVSFLTVDSFSGH